MGAESDASPYESEDYADDDFEEQDGALSGNKFQSLAVAGQVHPLDPLIDSAAPPAVVKTGDDDEEGYDDGGSDYSDFEGEKTALSASKPSALTLQVENRALPVLLRSSIAGKGNAHDDGDDVESADNRSETDHSVTGHAKLKIDLVSIHAHREPLLPPPAPVHRSFLQRDTVEITLQQLRLSEQCASIAAKRILEYRGTQAQREAEQAAEAAAAKKERGQFRASNRKIYEQMGVSKLTGEQRHQVLVEERKLLKQHRDVSAKLEKQQRWYNAKATTGYNRKSLAPVHVAELQVQHSDFYKQIQRDTVQRSQNIKAHQVELHQQAHAIVAKCTQTQYVRGSYLLKKAKPRQSQMKTRSKSELLAHENADSTYTLTVTQAPAVAATYAHEIIAT